MEKITRRQKEILDWIDKRENLSLKEIGEHFNIKPSSVYVILKKLESKKLIERTRKARSLRVVKENVSELYDKPFYHWVIDEGGCLLYRKHLLLDEPICFVIKDLVKTFSEDFGITLTEDIKEYLDKN